MRIAAQKMSSREERIALSVQKSDTGGLLQRLKSCADSNGDPLVALHGLLSVLTKLEAGFEEDTFEQELDQLYARVREDGAVNLLIDALSQNSEKLDVAEASIQLLRLLAHTPSNQQVIVEAGGIALVISTMKKHTSSPGVQREGCAALRNFSMEDAHDNTILSEGGLSCIVSAMMAHRDHADVQREACWAIANLAVSSACREAVTASGGLPAIVDALTMHVGDEAVQIVRTPRSHYQPPRCRNLAPDCQIDCTLRNDRSHPLHGAHAHGRRRQTRSTICPRHQPIRSSWEVSE